MPVRRWMLASGLLFAVSLLMPAIVVVHKPLFGGTKHDEVMFGYQCLVIGFVAMPAWLANPLLLAAAIAQRFKSPRVARVFAIAALGCALSSAYVIGKDLRHFHVGYFAWLASIIAMVIATVLHPPPRDELA